MSVRTYYRLSLALPLAVPLGVAGLGFLARPAAGPDLLFQVCLVLLMSLFCGGVPYAILAGVLLWWSRGRQGLELIASLVLAPLLMLPLVWLWNGLILLLPVLGAGPQQLYGENAAGFLTGAAVWMLYLSLFTLGLGYFYVLAALVGLALLKGCGCVRVSSAA